MTTWEWLTSKSSIAVGTAFEHLISVLTPPNPIITNPVLLKPIFIIGGSIDGIISHESLEGNILDVILENSIEQTELSSNSSLDITIEDPVSNPNSGLI